MLKVPLLTRLAILRSRIISPLEALYSLSREYNFKIVIITRQWPFSDELLNLSIRRNLTLIDLEKVNEQAGYNKNEEFCIVPRDCHPNATGHRVIGNALFNALVGYHVDVINAG